MLGELEALPDAPPGESFWQGSFVHRDDGYEQQSPFYLCSGADESPSPALVEFATRIMARVDDHISAARRLLGSKIAADPSAFGIGHDQASQVVEDLPFDIPEPTFYAPGEWQIRFAQSSLPEWPPLGMAVVFVDEEPVRVDDLSESDGLG